MESIANLMGRRSIPHSFNSVRTSVVFDKEKLTGGVCSRRSTKPMHTERVVAGRRATDLWRKY